MAPLRGDCLIIPEALQNLQGFFEAPKGSSEVSIVFFKVGGETGIAKRADGIAIDVS